MANGLRDQLLKAGLVNEKQVKKAQQEKRKEQKQSQQKGGPSDEQKQRIQQAQAEKAERDRQLNLERKREQEQKAVAAQIRQLIETNRQPKGEGDTAYNFVDGNKVKRMYAADKVRAQIAKGRLAIVRLDDQYELVPPEIAEKIRQRDESAVVLLNTPQREEKQPEADDPYAAYQVPDDLMW
jgi:uncharacterized protein YaiL (DUF2058 family)